MKVFINLVFAMLFSQLLNAQAQDFSRQIADTQKLVGSISEETSILNGRIAATRSQIQKAIDDFNKNKRVKVIKTCVGDDQNNCTSDTQIEISDTMKSAYEGVGALKAQLAKLESIDPKAAGSIGEAQARLDKATKELIALQRQSRNQDSTSRNQLSDWADDLRTLDSNLNKAKYSLLSSDSMLNQVQAKWDKTILGVYMNDKMGQLVASDSFCKAQDMCVAKPKPSRNERIKALSPLIRTELFSGQTQGLDRSAFQSTSGAAAK